MLTLRKFKITNPYAGVDWDSWHHYKTNLHTHSTASDAQVDFSDMIKAYYDAGFDILAMTDHGVVNHGWNQKPRRIPVLSVSSIIKKPTWLSDEEYGAILDGTYKNRGRGMTDLRYGIEINTAVFTKAHVNGFFTEYGQGLVGHENDFEGPVKGVAESGGLSVINHPGDWLESYVDVNHAHEKKNVELFADILKRYPSCLGIEAFNRIDTVTCADRILWDELLSAVIPSGRNVWASRTATPMCSPISTRASWILFCRTGRSRPSAAAWRTAHFSPSAGALYMSSVKILSARANIRPSRA